MSECTTFVYDKTCSKLQLEKSEQRDNRGNDESAFKNDTKLHVKETVCERASCKILV